MSVNFDNTVPSGPLVWFNGLNLAWKFALGFGALFVVVLILAIIKLIWDKTRLQGHIKREKLEQSRKEQYADDIAIKRLSSMEEGELFGVRAIQQGFFGGVAQSAPNSPMGSRAPSLYNQPTTPSSPLAGGNSPYMPLMHPQPTASPMASSTSLVMPRSPLSANPPVGGPEDVRGAPSPIPNALLRDSRPGTSASNRGFDLQRPPMGKRSSTQSSNTINLDGLTPGRHAQQQQHQPQPGTSLRPSTSDASNTSVTSPPSTKNGTTRGSRSSSFTSTYSYDDAPEHQSHHPKDQQLPTLPVLQPIASELHNGSENRKLPSSQSPPRNYGMNELPTDLAKSPPKDTNFSAPFRGKAQFDQPPPPSPGFGPLPAAAMNAGPQQFNGQRTASPGPQQFNPQRTASPGPGQFNGQRTASPGPGQFNPQRTASPGPMNRGPPPPNGFPPRGPPNPRSMSPAGPGPRGQMQSQNERDLTNQGQRRGAPTPLRLAPSSNQEPSLPSFLQDSGAKTAPLNKTSSNHLMPEMPGKKNRLTADILNDFYDQYTYNRLSKDDIELHSNPNFQQMNRIPQPNSLPGSPRQPMPRQGPWDRR